MKRIILTVLFISTQIICALGALYTQLMQTYNDKSTQGLSLSLFACMSAFSVLNAWMSYRIWKPLRPRLFPTTETDAEKEGRDGFVLYFLSAMAYVLVFTFCGYKRIYIENVLVFSKQDVITLGVLIILLFIIWICTLSDPEARRERLWSNPHYMGALACVIICIPQISAGIQFLRLGVSGVSNAALWFALVMVLGKITYYVFIRRQSEDRYKKSKAEGVLIGEAGNLVSWLFVMWAFYHATQ